MEDYEKKYKEALANARQEYNTTENVERKQWLEELFPELGDSEDEKIKRTLIRICKKALPDIFKTYGYEGDKENIIAWLEKQSYTKKDVDDAYLKGICDAKDELEKQGTPAKLSEEEQNSFAKGVLSNCALSFINYLDAHSYEGKMCVSNGECEDIENAFHNAMWDRLHRYYCKYIEKQGEQKPILDFKASNFYVSKVDGKIHDITYNSTDKVEPKFKIGDVLCDKSCTTLNKNSQPNIKILDIRNDMYICNNCIFPISQQNEYELVTKKIEPQSAWSDEDEEMLHTIIVDFKGFKHDNTSTLESHFNECIDWLKSLKDRITWKPSKEQMDALLGIMIESGFDYIDYNTLESLYNDLKKL